MKNFLKKQAILVVVALVVALAWTGWVARVNLVKMQETMDTQYSLLQAQMINRAKIGQDLVDEMGILAQYDPETLDRFKDGRDGLQGAKDLKSLMEADAKVEDSLGIMFMVIANMPELQANQDLAMKQSQLVNEGKKIEQSESDYNDTLIAYNKEVRRFPVVIVAELCGFKPVAAVQLNGEIK